MQPQALIKTPESAERIYRRARSYFRCGDFVRASSYFAQFLDFEGRALRPRDVAHAKHHLACCLDRIGAVAEADLLFRSAAQISPNDFSMPPRFSRDGFESIVTDAIDSLPQVFDPYLSQVQFQVKDYAGRETTDPFCLGLYIGAPRTERSPDEKDHLDQVFIYKRTHEIEFPNETLFEEVRKTVVHEIGHHFGLEEHEMGEYE